MASAGSLPSALSRKALQEPEGITGNGDHPRIYRLGADKDGYLVGSRNLHPAPGRARAADERTKPAASHHIDDRAGAMAKASSVTTGMRYPPGNIPAPGRAGE